MNFRVFPFLLLTYLLFVKDAYKNFIVQNMTICQYSPMNIYSIIYKKNVCKKSEYKASWVNWAEIISNWVEK